MKSRSIQTCLEADKSCCLMSRAICCQTNADECRLASSYETVTGKNEAKRRSEDARRAQQRLVVRQDVTDTRSLHSQLPRLRISCSIILAKFGFPLHAITVANEL